MEGSNIFPILIAGVIVLVVIVLLVVILGKKNGTTHSSTGNNGGHGKTKTQAQVIKDANKRLAKNPHDTEALAAVGDVYYTNQVWEKAYTTYDQLSKLLGNATSPEAVTAALRCGACALKLEKVQEAMAALNIAYKINPSGYEVNYYMGLALFKNKLYDKAVPCLKKALILNPDAQGVYLILGQCYYFGHHYRDSLPCLKKALNEEPSNKEALFQMADAMTQEGHGDKAIKVFMHLRADPQYGAKSCLEAGIYHSKMGDFESAIQDFEIGLKHQNTPPEVTIEIEYRYAQCWLNKNQFGKGIEHLAKVREINPNYKDAAALITRYQELSQNKNLQVYLSSGTSDFVTLCRKLITNMNKFAQIKFQDINVTPAYTDIMAQIDTPKWEGLEVLRFFRTSGSTGELYVRDFYGHMHDVKADRGYCITAGSFTEDAHKFCESRPIDIIEKTELTKLLKAVSV